MSWTTGGVVGNSGSSGATISGTIGGSNIPAGSTVIVEVLEIASTIGGSVSDSKGNTYVAVPGAFLNGVSSNGFGRMFYASNIVSLIASTDTVTYTRETSGSVVSFTSFYIKNSLGTPTLDPAVTASATGTGAAASVTSGTPNQPGEFVFAFLTFAAENNYNGPSSSGWTQGGESDFAGGSVAGSYQIVAGETAETYDPTFQGSAWAAFIFGFAPPSQSPGTIGLASCEW